MSGMEGKMERPLPEKEAHDEAAMLGAQLELTGVESATAEDYEAALAAIEELKQLAGNPEAMKTVDIFARLAERSKFAFNIVTASISHAPFAYTLVNKAMSDHEKAMYQLGSVEEKLRILQKKAGVGE